MNQKTNAPFPPQWIALGMEAHFTELPPGSPWPVQLQVRIPIQPTRLAAGRPQQRAHTEWFALTPELARQLAADLQDAANRAELQHPPQPSRRQ